MTLLTKLKRLNLQIACVGGVLLLGRFFPLLLGKTIFFGDNFSLIVPGKIFTALWLRNGTVPLWNPYILNGIPWFANLNESVFYPSTLIFMIFNPATALNITTVGHLVFTFVGMYLFVKSWTGKNISSWLGAILWVYSTQVTGSMNNLTTLQSIAWVPWVLLLSLKLKGSFSSILILSFFIVGEILGGYPQYVFYTIIVGFLLSVWSQRKSFLKTWRTRIAFLVRWMVVGIFSLGLSAFALLPFLQNLHNSTRTIQTQTQSITGSLHPLEPIKILVPYFFDNPAAGMKWGPSWNTMSSPVLYVTWIGLFALAWLFFSKSKDKNDLFLGLVVGISFLFSFGDRLPGFRVLQVLLPFFKASRGPSLVLAITNVLLILWVSDVFSRLLFSKKLFITLRNISFMFLSVLLVFRLVIGSNFPSYWSRIDNLLDHKFSNSSFHTPDRDQIIFNSITTNLIFNAAMFLLAMTFWKKGKHILFLTVILIDMLANTSGMVFFAPKNVYTTWKEIGLAKETPILNEVGDERVLMSNFNTPYTDFGSYWDALSIRKPFSDSYVDSQELASFGNLKRMRFGMTVNWNMIYSLHTLNGYTSMIPKDFNATWNDGYSPPAINSITGISLGHKSLQDWGINYYLVDTWFPNITPPKLPLIISSDWLKLYQLSHAGRFQYDKTKVQINETRESPNELRISFIGLNPAKLIIADRYDPDWHAILDGKNIAIQNAYGRRAVLLPVGAHDLVIRYKPIKFYLGTLISLTTLVLALTLWYHARKTNQSNV